MDYIWKIAYYIAYIFSKFLVLLIPIYRRHFSKTGRGCKKIFTRKNDFFGGVGVFLKIGYIGGM